MRQLIVEGGSAVDGSFCRRSVDFTADSQAIDRIAFAQVALPPGVEIALFSRDRCCDCGRCGRGRSRCHQPGLHRSRTNAASDLHRSRTAGCDRTDRTGSTPVFRNTLRRRQRSSASSHDNFVLLYRDTRLFLDQIGRSSGFVARMTAKPDHRDDGQSSGDPHCSDASVDLARHRTVE